MTFDTLAVDGEFVVSAVLKDWLTAEVECRHHACPKSLTRIPPPRLARGLFFPWVFSNNSTDPTRFVGK